MADQVAVMRGGRLVQLADPQTLYRRPGDLDIAAFVGDAVVLDAEVRSGIAHCALGEVSLEQAAPDGAVRILLRPEQLQLGAAGRTGTPARVRSVDFYGHDARVLLDLPAGSTVTARLDGHELPADGQDVVVTVVGGALTFPASSTGAEPVPAGHTSG